MRGSQAARATDHCLPPVLPYALCAPPCARGSRSDDAVAQPREYTLRGDSVQFVSDFHQNVQFPGSTVAGRLDIEDSLVVRLVGEGPLTQFSFVR
jgi:hypothetical protein